MPSNSSRPASHIKENVPPFKPSIAERVKARARSKRPLESLNEEKFTVKVGDLGKTPEEQERLEAEEEEERRRAEEETDATASKRRKTNHLADAQEGVEHNAKDDLGDSEDIQALEGSAEGNHSEIDGTSDGEEAEGGSGTARNDEGRVVGEPEGGQGENTAERSDDSVLEERYRAPEVMFFALPRRARNQSYEDDDESYRGSLSTESSLHSERDASHESRSIQQREVDDLGPAHPNVVAANDEKLKAKTQGSHRTWSTAVAGDSWKEKDTAPGSDSEDEEY